MSLPAICRCHQVPNNPDCPFHGHLVNVAAPSASKPVEISCIEWMDALRDEIERMLDEAQRERKGVNFAMKPFYDGERFALKRILERMERRLESASIAPVSYSETATGSNGKET